VRKESNTANFVSWARLWQWYKTSCWWSYWSRKK